MAQASSVPAREPSMEEILASIRRIIEDSDGAHPAANDAVAPAAEAAAPQQGESADFGSGEVEAFRSELSAMEQETEPQDSPPVEAQPVMESAQPAPSHEMNTVPEPELYAEDAPEPASYEPAEYVQAEAPRTETVYEPATQEQAGGNAPARASILSETAGRQVAAAFGELSDAFASSQRRSFDEIAEELMRPMLQDWLDNNLPVLVERLVREEIERVARGGAR